MSGQDYWINEFITEKSDSTLVCKQCNALFNHRHELIDHIRDSHAHAICQGYYEVIHRRGVAYRRSPRFEDRINGFGVHSPDVVMATHVMKDWIQVYGGLWLPIAIDGNPVLRRVGGENNQPFVAAAASGAPSGGGGSVGGAPSGGQHSGEAVAVSADGALGAVGGGASGAGDARLRALQQRMENDQIYFKWIIEQQIEPNPEEMKQEQGIDWSTQGMSGEEQSPSFSYYSQDIHERPVMHVGTGEGDDGRAVYWSGCSTDSETDQWADNDISSESASDYVHRESNSDSGTERWTPDNDISSESDSDHVERDSDSESETQIWTPGGMSSNSDSDFGPRESHYDSEMSEWKHPDLYSDAGSEIEEDGRKIPETYDTSSNFVQRIIDVTSYIPGIVIVAILFVLLVVYAFTSTDLQQQITTIVREEQAEVTSVYLERDIHGLRKEIDTMNAKYENENTPERKSYEQNDENLTKVEGKIPAAYILRIFENEFRCMGECQIDDEGISGVKTENISGQRTKKQTTN